MPLLVSVKVVKYSCCFYSLSCFFSPVFLQPPKPNQRRRGRLLPPPMAGCASAHASPSHRLLNRLHRRPRPRRRPPRALVCSPRRRPLALSTWSTNNRNRQKYVERMTVGAHHVSVWKNKMLPPSVFLTSGTHDIVSVYSQ